MAFKKLESAGYLTNHAARLFAQALREKISPLGIAPAQFMVLIELWQEDGLTQSELVTRLDVEQATMANTLARMERDGLIERRQHPEDKRARMNFLTPKARSLEVEATNAAREVNTAFLEPLSAGERTQFIGLMRRIIGKN